MRWQRTDLREIMAEVDHRYRTSEQNSRFVKDSFIDTAELLGLWPGEFRAQGHTTHQMQHAPPEAIFIWCSSDTWYPCRLALHLGREDLDIKGSHWILDEGNFLRTRDLIVLDHALFHPQPKLEPMFKV